MVITALVASLVSIVLGVVAIYYAFKFNREGHRSLEKTQDLLTAVGRNVRYIEAVAEHILEKGFKYVLDKKSFFPKNNKPAQGEYQAIQATKEVIMVQQEDQKELQRYKCFLEEVRYTQNVVWRVFGAFLLPQTVFLAFLLRASFGDEKFISPDLGVFIAAVIGFCLCLPWWSSYRQMSKCYYFRVAQTRELEELECSGWDLISGKGKDFSRGKLVKAGGEEFQLKWFQIWLRVGHAIPGLIAGFFAIFGFIGFTHNPWILRILN